MIFVSFPSGSQPGGGTLLAHCFPDAKTPQTAQKVNGWGPFFANDSQGYIAYGTGNFDGQVRVCVCVCARARACVCVCVCASVHAGPSQSGVCVCFYKSCVLIAHGSAHCDGQDSGHDFNGTVWHPTHGYVNSCDGGRSHWSPVLCTLHTCVCLCMRACV